MGETEMGTDGGEDRAVAGVGRHIWRCAAGCATLVGLFVVFLLLKPGSATFFNTADNATQTLIEVIAFLLALPILLPRFVRQRGSERGSRGFSVASLSPVLLALGILS